MSGERILVVDDDFELSEQVSNFLAQQGFEVSRAVDGDEALAMVSGQRFELVLLDVIMPGLDGFSVCRKIRETSQVPIIMATAIGDESAKVQMLQAGADDYVVKPYSLPELHARMNAVLRRATVYSPNQEVPEFTKDDLKINYMSHEVTVSGKDIDLTSTEFNLLKELTTHAGEVLTHRALLHAVWGAEYGEEREYVRVFVNRLRQKLGDDPASPRFIKTEAGVGYLFLKGP